ncbi:Hypothetical predicted protein, partial [Paramuricea clavata]
EPSVHSHPPDPSCVAVKRAVSAMIHRAENSEESTSNIIQNCTHDFPLAAAGSLPKRETLARMIRSEKLQMAMISLMTFAKLHGKSSWLFTMTT